MTVRHWCWVGMLGLLLLGGQASAAKRLGGGVAVGKPATQVSGNAAGAPVAAPTAASRVGDVAPVAAAPQRRWGGVLGGLAAGLGLAWLASSLGLGEGFAQVLMVALLVALGAAVLRWLLIRRSPAASTGGGLAYQVAHGSGDGQAALPRSYSPKNVGNDASARPWEAQGAADGAAPTGPALAGLQGGSVPAGFDTDGFLKASKANFVGLQAAWDRGDIASLRAMMTDSMLEDIKGQLAEREKAAAGSPNQTDVVMLDARLLGIEEQDLAYIASVEFSGLIREEASAGPNPFREVWAITRPKSGQAGWLVAGVQALQ